MGVAPAPKLQMGNKVAIQANLDVKLAVGPARGVHLALAKRVQNVFSKARIGTLFKAGGILGEERRDRDFK